MKLGDLFTGKRASEGACTAPTKSVKFKVLGERDGEQLMTEASAVFRFVPEDEAETCRIEAERALRDEFPGGAPADLIEDARAFRIIQRALRDEDDPRQPFARDVASLQAALQQRVAVDLFRTYIEWARVEFPETVDDEMLDKLIAEASKKSLPDLLSQFDSSEISRAWGSLVAHFGKLRKTPTSSAG